MITIFHALAFFGFLAAIVAGIQLGARLAGTPGAILGALLGATAAVLTIRTLSLIGRRRLAASLARTPTDKLRADLRGPVWPAYHLFMGELARRGELLESEFPIALTLLNSTGLVQRIHGWTITRLYFPDRAALIPDHDPHAGPDPCRDLASRLTAATPPAPTTAHS